MRKELLKGLTPEQIEKVKACKNSDEILALAKAEGVQLSDEQLEAVSGGGCVEKRKVCPDCGRANTKRVSTYTEGSTTYHRHKCNSCGHEWTVKD